MVFVADGGSKGLILTCQLKPLHAETQTRWRTSRLDFLLAGAAILLLRLLRDAEAWATSVDIFSPPCLEVLALVRRVGDSSPLSACLPKYSPLLVSFGCDSYCCAEREFSSDKDDNDQGAQGDNAPLQFL